MAFIRDYFKNRDQGPGEEEKPTRLLEPIKMGGGGAGPTRPTVFTPTQAQASTGARAPLLADYLRANVGSSMAQKAAADVAKQAGALEGKEWQVTSQGLQEKPASMRLSGDVLTAAPKPQAAAPQAGVKRFEGLQGTPQKGVQGFTLEAQQPSVEQMISARQQGATATLRQSTTGQTPAERAVAARQQGATATLKEGTAVSPVMTPAEAAKQAEQVEAEATELGTQAGREAYLQEKYGKGQQYTTGEAMLDAALMGGLAGSQLSGLAKKYEQLYETVSGKQKAAQTAYDREQERKRLEAEAEPKLGPGESRETVMVDPEQVRKDQAFLKAQQIRKEDEPLKQGRGKGSKQTYTLTREELANRAGMTLEEWILAGEPEI